MEAYVEAVDGDTLLKFNKCLLEEVDNKISISGPQNFIYAFYDTVGDAHGLNR